MKALITLAVGLGVLWLIGVTVIAVWPVVTDAPWEESVQQQTENAIPRLVRCEDALERRRDAGASLGMPLQIPAVRDTKLLEDQLAAAERDISQYCQP